MDELTNLPPASEKSDLLFDAGFPDFFIQLFTPQYFTSRLLERSFNQTSGWVELGITLFLMIMTLKITDWWIARKMPSENIPRSFWRHLGRRLLWPIVLLLCAIATLYLWNVFGYRAIWLRLLVLASSWMILIRLFLSVIHAALPANAIADKIERLLAMVLWAAFLVWVSGIDTLVINWMKELKLAIGSSQLSLWTICVGIVWVGSIMMAAMWLAKVLQRKLLTSNSLDLSLRIMLSNLARMVLIILSILIALPIVGIDLTVLSVFGGAVGVGIGFGLQKVASNYISGFMILGDRSIRPGDRLTVNNFTGYVTKITSRFVVLRSAVGAEALIPNETFITSMVINESYTGKALYKTLDVQVSYQSDIELAMSIMKEAASKQERVDQWLNNKPNAFLVEFASDGINLRLGFWVKDPENGFQGLFSAILLDIWREFKAAGIEFPYPQREVRILNDMPSEKIIPLQSKEVLDESED